MSSVIRQLRTEPLSPSLPSPQLLSSHRPVAETRGIGSTRRAVLIHCFRPAREDNLTQPGMCTGTALWRRIGLLLGRVGARGYR